MTGSVLMTTRPNPRSIPENCSTSIPQYMHPTNWLFNLCNHCTTTQNRDLTKSSHAKRSPPSIPQSTLHLDPKYILISILFFEYQ